MLWIPITIFAALMQSIRTALQKRLTAYLPTDIITWIRYGFGLPFAILYLVLLTHNDTIPLLSLTFISYCFLAGIMQIIATVLLITLFSYGNFAVGTTYTKTEVLQTVLIGALLFGEHISLLALIIIIIGFMGVLLLSLEGNTQRWLSILKNFKQKQAVIGLLSGTCFGFTAFFIREASHSLGGDAHFINAATTMVVTIALQTIILGVWIIAKHRQLIHLIKPHLPASLLIGLTSMLGSFGWYTAVTLANPAYVRSVGQIELLFCLLITHYIFKEHVKKTQLVGIAIILTSIILLSLVA